MKILRFLALLLVLLVLSATPVLAQHSGSPGKSGEESFVTISSDAVITVAQCRGKIMLITGAYTPVLPAVSGFTGSDGGSCIFYATTAATFSIDPNADDRIVLDGTALDDGDKITSPGTAGAFVVLVNDSADGWRTLGRYGIFTDGG